MQAVRARYKSGQVELLEPIINVTEAELYIVVVNEKNESEISEESMEMMQMQSQSHFARHVLLDPAEDVWNDL